MARATATELSNPNATGAAIDFGDMAAALSGRPPARQRFASAKVQAAIRPIAGCGGFVPLGTHVRRWCMLLQCGGCGRPDSYDSYDTSRGCGGGLKRPEFPGYLRVPPSLRGGSHEQPYLRGHRSHGSCRRNRFRLSIRMRCRPSFCSCFGSDEGQLRGSFEHRETGPDQIAVSSFL